MKENGLTLANLMDFEYCQGGIGFSLKDIREENGDDNNSRPWLVESNDKKIIEKLKEDKLLTLEDVEKFHTKLSLLGRTNIKGLAVPVSLSETALRTELRRIIAHMSKDKKENKGFKSDADIVEYFVENKKLLKDLVRMYDMGYGKAKEGEEKNAK